MKKEKKKIFVIVGAVVACLAVVYVGFGIFFQSHFCFGTTIDGIKAGGKSVEKVEQLITEEIDSYVLNLAEREDGSESISGESIQIAPVFNGEVEELFPHIQRTDILWFRQIMVQRSIRTHSKKQWRIPFWFWQMSLILTRLTAM